jgi:5'(3')-deoxyribonucleotidase
MMNLKELKTAANKLKDNRLDCQDMNAEVIAQVLERHLESIIEDALNDPEYFFRNQPRFWRDLQKAAIAQAQEQQAA